MKNTIFTRAARAIAATVLPTGTQRINAALAQFEAIAEELEAGAKSNRDAVAVNKEQIAQLELENDGLESAADRGETVAASLREMLEE